MLVFCYTLHGLEAPDSVEGEEKDAIQPIEEGWESTNVPLIDIDEEDVQLEPNEETSLFEKFNKPLFRVETITKV